ncbi:beta strand repeat-containing protein [Mesorhizobium kowhaii]|uniref:beta strand repeat-containing protein n=1 Tax=Mesorhizobium kowhaii TaxID=1300272 RepID=UPI0035E7FFAD
MAIISGTSANNTLYSLASDDFMYGYGGSDTFVYDWGNGWDDFIGGEDVGGADRDRIQFRTDYFGSAEIRIRSISGIEVFDNSNSNYSPKLRVDGSLDLTEIANDSVSGGYAAFTGKWYDTLNSPDKGYKFYLLEVEGWTGNDVINTSALVNANFAPVNFTYFTGSVPAVLIAGLGGNDEIHTGAGNDVIYGDERPDVTYSSVIAGNDLLYAGAGNDEVHAGGGNDVVYGQADDDVLSGDDGDDELHGDSGDDTLRGGAGNDALYGDAGHNTIDGGAGHDIVYLGGLSSDWTQGTDGSGTLTDTNGVDVNTLLSIEEIRFLSDPGNPIVFESLPTPIADNDGGANQVAEDAANGTAVGIAASSVDPDGNSIVYTLTDSAGGAFAIDSATGVVTVADVSKLDYETRGSLQIIVDATDGIGHVTETFTIAILDGNDAPSAPTDSNAAANTVAEGAANGTTVGITAAATDPNSDTLTYSLVYDAGGRFTIDATTGVVTVANGSLLDYETAQSHQITVRASDGQFWKDQIFTIGVTNVSDNPVLTGTAGNDTLIANSPDNWTIHGLGGNDTITGGTGNDIIFGDAGDDTLNGGNGDDIFLVDGAAEGFDAVTGGVGTSDVIKASSDGTVIGLRSLATIETITADGHSNVTISGDGTANVLSFSGVTLTGIVAISGGDGNDSITGGAANNTINGDGGNDTLVGGAGVDILTGGAGNDTLLGLDGNDVFLLGGSADGFDSVTGGNGTDTIKATSDHTIIGLTSIATIEAITADGHANIIISGDGAANSLSFVGVTLTGIASINGGDGGDTITGSAAGDTIVGGMGSDALNGGDGNDVFLTGGTNDGFDGVAGGNGSDVLKATSNGTIIGLASIATIEAITADGYSNVTIAGSTAANTLDFSAVALTGITSISGSAGNDIITGTSGDDTIFGDAGLDTLNGGAGSDTLTGGADNDTLSGGDGDDVFLMSGASDGFDSVTGGNGTDIIKATADNMIIGLTAIATVEEISADGHAGVSISGSASADTLNFSALTLTGITGIFGGSGNDTITGSAAADIISGDAGDDTLGGSDGNDIFLFSGTAGGFDAITGGNGTDTIKALANGTIIGLRSIAGIEAITADGFANVQIAGSGNADTLDFSDTTLTGIVSIDGGAGNDIITGSAANDVIIANSGTDTLNGGDGNDVFSIGSGGSNHIINGGNGSDTIVATSTTLSIASFSGIEAIDGSGVAGLSIVGTGVADTFDFSATTLTNVVLINGGAGNDTITGSASDDVISGGAGADILNGGAGNDTVTYAASTAAVTVNLATTTQSGGDAQGDQLTAIEHVVGSNYADTLTGNTGDNSLNGGTGNDRLTGAGGDDLLTGGANNDTFVFRAGFGHDTIMDFAAGATVSDVIEFSQDLFVDYTAVLAAASDVGSDTLITLDANNSILLHNVTVASLNANDFLFVA